MSDKVTQDQVVDAPVVDAPANEPITQPTADVTTDDAPGTQEASGEVDNNIKSMSGKIQSLEKERNSLQQDKKTLEEQMRILEALDRRAKEDLEFGKIANKALVDEGIITEEQYNQMFQSEDTATKAQPSQSLDKDTLDAIEYAKQKRREEQEAEEAFFEKYEADKPELSEASESDARLHRQAIGVAAATNMRVRGMAKEQAYELAYKQILRPDLLKEEGELQGLAQAQNTDVSVGGGAGGSAVSGGSANLTQDELAVASAMGMTAEEYAASKEL